MDLKTWNKRKKLYNRYDRPILDKLLVDRNTKDKPTN